MSTRQTRTRPAVAKQTIPVVEEGAQETAPLPPLQDDSIVTEPIQAEQMIDAPNSARSLTVLAAAVTVTAKESDGGTLVQMILTKGQSVPVSADTSDVERLISLGMIG